MCKILVLAGLVGLILVPSLNAEIIYVDDDAPLGGDGQTWNTAYRYLQDALYAAEADPNLTEIRIAGGTYTPDFDEAGLVTPLDPNAAFRASTALVLAGAYAGIGAGDPNAVDSTLHPTSLSGDIDPNDAQHDSVVLFSFTGPTVPLSVRDMSLGSALWSSDTVIHMQASMISIYNCCFHDVSSPDTTAIHLSSPILTIEDCTFTSLWNMDAWTVFLWSPVLTIGNCEFTTIGGFGHDAVGLGGTGTVSYSTFTGCTGLSLSGSMNLLNCEITDCYPPYSWPMITIAAPADVFVADCDFADNGDYSMHSLISQTGGSFTCVNSRFERNDGRWAGVIEASDTVVSCDNTDFTENCGASVWSIPLYGSGVLRLIDCDATISNCTFTENQAGRGGAIRLEGGTAKVSNSSFVANFAYGCNARGGAIMGSDAEVQIDDCHFLGNFALNDNCEAIVVPGRGGALMIDSAQISHCEFAENSAWLGGAICGSNAIDSCIFRNNGASLQNYALLGPTLGGTVYGGGVITNSVLEGSIAVRGAAVDGTGLLANCVVVGNQSAPGGGGVSGTVQVTNSVLWDNLPINLLIPILVTCQAWRLVALRAVLRVRAYSVIRRDLWHSAAGMTAARPVTRTTISGSQGITT